MVITLFLILKTGTQNWTPYQNDHILTIPNSEGWVVEIYQDETLLYRETICNDGIVVIPSDIKGEMILKVTNGSIVYFGDLNL